METQRSLERFIRHAYKRHRFIIVTNREPYHHVWKDGKIVIQRAVGGVTVSLDSVARTSKGVWVAYGGSSADRAVVDEHDHVKLPPDDPLYTLRRVWISEREFRGYYDGFSNEALWPLCHVVFVRPTFRENDWNAYKRINRRFAKAVLEETKGKPSVVWIQDYHFARLPLYIKEGRRDIVVGHFWHIPWPTQEIFRICPWKREILEGLLASDLLGFHRFYHVDNFLRTVARELPANVDFEDLTIRYKNHLTNVRVSPISVDQEEVARTLERIEKKRTDPVRKLLGTKPEILALGVDRIDYTKGIPNRLRAIERFLEKYPKFRRRFVYLGLEAPSRTTIPAFRNVIREMSKLALTINTRFATSKWKPVVIRKEVTPREEILAAMRRADLCLVTSLDDGMNLVAKEFVLANAGDGALILSQFAGAAKELTDAWLVNPYDIEGMADTIAATIEADLSERRSRMRRMATLVRERNLFRWARRFLEELAKTAEESNRR